MKSIDKTAKSIVVFDSIDYGQGRNVLKVGGSHLGVEPSLDSEKPKASREWGMGRGYPLPSRLGGLEERRKLPQQVRASNDCHSVITVRNDTMTVVACSI